MTKDCSHLGNKRVLKTYGTRKERVLMELMIQQSRNYEDISVEKEELIGCEKPVGCLH